MMADQKRRNFLLGVCGLVAVGAFIKNGPGDNIEQRFSSPRFRGTTNVGAPATSAVRVLNHICDVVGIRKNITLYAANIHTSAIAFAAMRNGRRYIVYDRKLPWPSNDLDWKSVKVMAHEVGHHLGTHVFNREYSGHERELEADRFAGFALSRMGASLQQASSWFSWDWPGTPTHPSASRRRAALQEGWRLGEAMKRREGSQNVQIVTQTRYVEQPCDQGFVGAELQIGGRTCRIVRTCSDSNNGVRLACQDLHGNWVWQ